MIRLIILIFISITSVKTFACYCNFQYTTYDFYRADFVATAEIIKTNENKAGKDYYETEIIIKELYKGKTLKSINIDGCNNGKQWSSCDIKLIPGSKWLIFGYKDREGKISSGYCSMQRADDYNYAKRKIPFILETLRTNSDQLSEKPPGNIPYFNTDKVKTFDSKKVGDYTLVSLKLDFGLNVEKVIFYTDDTQIAKNRIETEIRNFAFKEHIEKNNINTKNGFFYIWELYPYTNIVEPDLRMH